MTLSWKLGSFLVLALLIVTTCVTFLFALRFIKRHFLLVEIQSIERLGLAARPDEYLKDKYSGIMVNVPNNADFSHFSDSTLYRDVTSLVVEGGGLTAAMFKSVIKIPRLERLWVGWQPLTNGDIEVLRGNNTIKFLSLAGTNITSLDAISRMKKLEELDIKDTYISENQLMLLCRLKRLRILWNAQARKLPCLPKLEVNPDSIKQNLPPERLQFLDNR